MTASQVRRMTMWGLMVTVCVCAATPAAFGAEPAGDEAIEGAGYDRTWVLAGGLFAAALAIGLAGLATAKVQSAVGAGGMGALAEKPELFTSVLILYAIPETIVVLGFVIAVLIIGKI